MAAAGFSKGDGGVYTSPSLGRVSFDVMTSTSPNNEAEMTVVAGGWRQAGFDVSETVNPPALGRDNEARATFKGVFIASTNVGDQTFQIFSTATLARPDNRWVGTNRGGFSDPEYDRLVEALSTTLERPARARILGQLASILTEHEPSVSLFFAPQPWVFVNELQGLKLAASDANMSWNMHEWELR
jgi:ABC-type transport system substrate-binding protein